MQHFTNILKQNQVTIFSFNRLFNSKDVKYHVSITETIHESGLNFALDKVPF
jgi:hypothetical protein